jgi:hypothetical protein
MDNCKRNTHLILDQILVLKSKMLKCVDELMSIHGLLMKQGNI